MVRHVDETAKTIRLEFSNGTMFGPIELNPTTDALTKIIANLEGRITALENQGRSL